MTVRASILVPTFNHADTLPLAVRSALAQNVPDLEVLIIGDGVTPETRAAAESLAASDDRVRFLDFPKGPHHGEIYRHEAIVEARSPNIFYLCDDDLLLPDHVGDLLKLLETCNFVQSRNGYFKPNGEVFLFVTDLSDREAVAWHLLMPPRNRVSLTGTAHRRDFYLALERGWETTPKGYWPDHFMWMKFFARPEFRGATSTRMTALQLPTSEDGRDQWTGAQRLAELTGWAELVAAPDGQIRIDEIVEKAARQTLQRLDRAFDIKTRELADVREELSEAKQEAARWHAVVVALYNSRSWRVTKPLRVMLARFQGSHDA